jgi:very-short-patch-repair endonuclease
VSHELADLFVDAARAADSASTGGPDAVDRARSAAERFLFERLESLPETAGLFRLNARPGFRSGSVHALEVDLLAESLRLAVEVDGYYHFRDADAYRRDRRKDLELQRRGYLVVRVLADDVVRRLEEILETILDLVARQARPAPRS